jgi:hypothetical protein
MSRHTPIRGAVEVGKGFEWPEGGVYGPIMADVYELESQIAYYPRIVIGQDLSSRICGWNKELQENNSYYVGYKELISTGKPPALPGDSKSLTDTGVVHQTRRL